MADETRRLLLQERLEQVTGLPERDVHFQPPTGTEMRYPAVVYSRSRPDVDFADNLPYRSAEGYTVTVIHKDPDDPILSKMSAFRYCRFERWYAADALNHDVYNLFF